MGGRKIQFFPPKAQNGGFNTLLAPKSWNLLFSIFFSLYSAFLGPPKAAEKAQLFPKTLKNTTSSAIWTDDPPKLNQCCNFWVPRFLKMVRTKNLECCTRNHGRCWHTQCPFEPWRFHNNYVSPELSEKYRKVNQSLAMFSFPLVTSAENIFECRYYSEHCYLSHS